MLIEGLIGIAVLIGVYFGYKYFEPAIRFRKYLNAFKIGAIVKAGKESEIDVETYLEMKVKSLEDEVNKAIAKAMEKVGKKKKGE